MSEKLSSLGQKTAALVHEDRYKELLAANQDLQAAIEVAGRDSPGVEKALKRFIFASKREGEVNSLLQARP